MAYTLTDGAYRYVPDVFHADYHTLPQLERDAFLGAHDRAALVGWYARHRALAETRDRFSAAELARLAFQRWLHINRPCARQGAVAVG